MDSSYQGILFPDRAESRLDERFSEYRVFLEHWDPLAKDLRTLFEGMAIRGETRTLGIYGPQGVGKTMFAGRLHDDYVAAKKAYSNGNMAPDPNRLWDRMAGGASMNAELLGKAALNSDMDVVEDEDDWVTRITGLVAGRKGRQSIIVADNAERPYFRQSLVKMSDLEYVQHGESEGALKLAAQRFVALCRGPLRGCVIVLLSNDLNFVLGFSNAVDTQHKGMMPVTELPAPGSDAKETIVRINTNRLNPISYWYCLDKAGPEEKVAVYEALQGAETFPGSFAAVDTAIRTATSARIGRPAKNSTLTLILLTEDSSVSAKAELAKLGEVEYPDKPFQWFEDSWFAMAVLRTGWARPLLGAHAGGLLESEWNLRVVVLGAPFSAALLSGDARVQNAVALLKKLETVPSPGTHATTRQTAEDSTRLLVASWPDCSDIDMDGYWTKKQQRASDYEGVLRAELPGYDTSPAGFIEQRPDYVVSPYVPCAILASPAPHVEQINQAIKRQASVFEFTSTRTFSCDYVRKYLTDKLTKYVHTMREQ